MCVAALLLAALTPAFSGHACGVLVPLGPLFGLVALTPVIAADTAQPQPLPVLDTSVSRAPPSA